MKKNPKRVTNIKLEFRKSTDISTSRKSTNLNQCGNVPTQVLIIPERQTPGRWKCLE